MSAFEGITDLTMSADWSNKLRLDYLEEHESELGKVEQDELARLLEWRDSLPPHLKTQAEGKANDTSKGGGN